jgi:hypothetical protein
MHQNSPCRTVQLFGEKSIKRDIVTFEELIQWCLQNLQKERQFQTLGKWSHFYARYEQENEVIILRLSTGSQYRLRKDQVRRIFDRWLNGNSDEKYTTSFYTDPRWPNTPNRKSSPAIPAIIKFWVQQQA